MVIIAATQTLPAGKFIHRSQIVSDPDSSAGKSISGYDHNEPSGRKNQVHGVALLPLMAGWQQFEAKGWNHELAGLDFSERKSLLFLASCGPPDSKIPGELLFQKKLCYHASHGMIRL
jgi:hypothetical protein